MRRLVILLFIIVICLFHTIEIDAQELSVDLYGGVITYQGDLVDGLVDFAELQPAFGAGIKYLWFKDIAVRGSVLVGKISGDDANSEKLASRGYSFESNITELSIAVEYHPLGQGRWSNRNELIKSISPYVFAGVGYMFGEPTVTGLPSTSEDLLNDITSRLVVPFGIGVQATFSEKYYVAFEGGTRYLTDDYLDGVSISGNPKANDWYPTVGLKIGFFLGGEPSMF